MDTPQRPILGQKCQYRPGCTHSQLTVCPQDSFVYVSEPSAVQGCHQTRDALSVSSTLNALMFSVDSSRSHGNLEHYDCTSLQIFQRRYTEQRPHKMIPCNNTYTTQAVCSYTKLVLKKHSVVLIISAAHVQPPCKLEHVHNMPTALRHCALAMLQFIYDSNKAHSAAVELRQQARAPTANVSVSGARLKANVVTTSENRVRCVPTGNVPNPNKV
eukprot:6189219-Pleurochrysis_carterae.AAC.1